MITMTAMRKKHKIGGLALLSVVTLFSVALIFSKGTFAVLDPAGSIAEEQRQLIIIASALCLLVVLPVFAMTVGIVWKYREGNTKAKYQPEWDHSRLAETIWWGGPLLIIIALGAVIWQSSHSLDPFRPISSSKQPLTVQVIALQWKWLFIYPEQNIATVNFMQLPVDRPINFRITADSPMNSFWIPQLGGQIYAMPGMETRLHLMALKPGDYRGVSANLSGEGFAGMKFTARASTETEFQRWINDVKRGDARLTQQAYDALAQPSANAPKMLFASNDAAIYRSVINTYMSHGSGEHGHE